MTLQELTDQMNALVRSKGWYDTDSPRAQTPRNLAISLSLEAAEVLEYFQWGEQIDDPEGLGSELADVMLYLLQLAYVSGIPLEEAVEKKIALNYTRSWSPDRKGKP